VDLRVFFTYIIFTLVVMPMSTIELSLESEKKKR